ncbi:unnamed protein product [Lactuca saligna]|uniref:Uncharacterized protein n=1 Tax=Lactuca saligna TaxID=75948 RepID=A0AA35YIS4_LACSI|nr:unnamed protein product [Lactuca saligna]
MMEMASCCGVDVNRWFSDRCRRRRELARKEAANRKREQDNEEERCDKGIGSDLDPNGENTDGGAWFSLETWKQLEIDDKNKIDKGYPIYQLLSSRLETAICSRHSVPHEIRLHLSSKVNRHLQNGSSNVLFSHYRPSLTVSAFINERKVLKCGMRTCHSHTEKCKPRFLKLTSVIDLACRFY